MPPFSGADGGITAMAVVPGRHELAVGSDDQRVRIIDFEQSQEGAPLVTETDEKGIRGMAFASGHRILALGSALWMFDTQKSDHPKLLTIPVKDPDAISALALSSGGARIVAGLADGSVQLGTPAAGRSGPPWPAARRRSWPFISRRTDRGC